MCLRVTQVIWVLCVVCVMVCMWCIVYEVRHMESSERNGSTMEDDLPTSLSSLICSESPPTDEYPTSPGSSIDIL